MNQEEETKCPDCGHMIRTIAGFRMAHDKDGLEPVGVGYWSADNSEGVGHVRCLPKPEPYESFLAKKPAKTDWTPKLFWFLRDPPDDDPSIPTWELVAEIAGHRFGLAMAWQESAMGTWMWCIQDTETCGGGTDPDGCVAFIRNELPLWADVIPEIP